MPSWEIGRPQQAFVDLFEAGLVHSPVLDIGCGTGELSLFLARHGLDVLGVDISPLAIAQAREKARGRRIPARFVVWDALDLAALGEQFAPFATVVDSAMFHLFSGSQRERFVSELTPVVSHEGLYALLGDVNIEPGRSYGITPGEVRSRFERSGAWRLEFAYRSVFERRWSVGDAWFLGLRRR